MIALRLLSALPLTAFVPCILSGQNPAASAPPSPMAAHRTAVIAAPGERRMIVRAVADQDMMRRMMMPDVASMFLGRAGQLQLNDSQVTRLAAIARRSASRMQAMHARMDSAMTTARSGDGAAMMMMSMPMQTSAERTAQHEDDRDAFSVLTADQLATAWETMASHHAMGDK